jgi:hypothetical protein
MKRAVAIMVASLFSVFAAEFLAESGSESAGKRKRWDEQ